MESGSWIVNELRDIDLGDARLNKRVLKLAGDMLTTPHETIMGASQTWAAAKGAYRLFSNERFSEADVRECHETSTLQRMESTNEMIFAIQDTMVINYTHHPKKKGLGHLNRDMHGCFTHNTLMVSATGRPIGLLDQNIFIHEKSERDSDAKQKPITEKESYRWIESLRKIKKLSKSHDVVMLSDRESDIYEYLHEAQQLEQKVIFRAAKNRALINGKDGDVIRLWEHMKSQPVQASYQLTVPKKHQKPERLADVELRYAKNLYIMPAKRRPNARLDTMGSVMFNAVWIKEKQPPNGEKGLEWLLLTNVAIEDTEDAKKMSTWYGMRWHVENFHRVLKSGCKIKDCRLENYESLKKFISLKSIVAFRLYELTHYSRTQPEASSEEIFSANELKALMIRTKKMRPASLDKPPTIYEATRLLAMLGGFLGRNSDGEPGMTHIWRGWERLEESVKMMEAMSCG